MPDDPLNVPDEPELPDPNWVVRALQEARKLAKELGPWAAVVMAALAWGQGCTNNKDSKVLHDETVQKVDATDRKVDKAAEVAVEVKKELAVQNAVVEKTAEKVTEVHKAVKGNK